MHRPVLSVVIPLHNEALVLNGVLTALIPNLAELTEDFELLLVENGSRDQTAALCIDWARSESRIRALRIECTDYGMALRRGIAEARGEFVLTEEIDICDASFHRAALALVRAGTDLVVASKAHPNSRDRRPLPRRLATFLFNSTLRLTLGFRGSDTHGPKMFRRERVAPIALACHLEGDLFATEWVLSTIREGFAVQEFPFELKEVRKTPVAMHKRLRGFSKDFPKLLLKLVLAS